MTLERLSVGIWKSAKLVEKSNPEGINQYTGGGGSGDVNGGGHTDQMMANHGHTSSVNNGTSAPTASQARLDHVLTARDSGTHANHGSGAKNKTSTIIQSRG